MKNSKFKEFWKKFWFVVWKDDSFKGWVISMIFLFLVIKFVFFPVLELSTGTKLPLVIVESCSMYHSGNLFSNTNSWWDSHFQKYKPYDITKEVYNEFSFKKGFNKGDILFIVGKKPQKLKVGDVIIFNANYKNPIIHRIIKIEQKENSFVFSTVGDNNNGQLSIEKEISEDQIIGKATANIAPYLGWIKLIFFEKARPTSERGFCGEN